MARLTLPIWALWAAATLVVLALAVQAGLDPPGSAGNGTVAEPLLGWDFNWYLALARDGYGTDGAGPEYAFYPLWPLVLHVLDAVGDPRTLAALVAAPLLSAAAFLGVVAANPSGDARRTAIALACFPGSFALLLPYTDALTVAAVAFGCVLAARGQVGAAAALGAVAAAARPTGFLAILPLAVLARQSGARAWWVAAVLPLASLAVVHGFFWARSGEIDAYRQAGEQWNRTDPLVVFDAVGSALGALPAVNDNTINGAIAVVCAGLLVALWRMGPGYRMWTLYSALALALPIVSGGFIGIGRYALLAFPLVWAAADGVAVLRRPAVVAVAAVASPALVISMGSYQP
jgi:hypothetical protein